MRDEKGKLNNKAILRNMNELAPILPNDNRWSGKCEMVNLFVSIRSELIAVSKEADCDLNIFQTNFFANKAKKYGNMLV